MAKPILRQAAVVVLALVSHVGLSFLVPPYAAVFVGIPAAVIAESRDAEAGHLSGGDWVAGVQGEMTAVLIVECALILLAGIVWCLLRRNDRS